MSEPQVSAHSMRAKLLVIVPIPPEIRCASKIYLFPLALLALDTFGAILAPDSLGKLTRVVLSPP